MSYLKFDKSLMINLEQSLAKEMLRTNQTGAYHCTTVVDCNTRKQHGLLRRVRDFAQVKGSGKIDPEIARYALEALNIDRYGLDEIDNKLLRTIIDKFGGGPVGLTTIATAIGEDPGTVEEVYEPFLIKEGFIKRTPRGREVTMLAYTHLGRTPLSSEPTLFS